MAKPNWIWKETAEVLGVLGVIASLIFVAFEIRQNTNAVQSATIQAISEQSFELTLRSAENAELLAIMRKAEDGESLSVPERDQLSAVYRALMVLNMNRLAQMELGVLDENTVFAVGGRGPGYRSPFFAEFWAESRHRYSPEFIEFVESELLPLVGDTN